MRDSLDTLVWVRLQYTSDELCNNKGLSRPCWHRDNRITTVSHKIGEHCVNSVLLIVTEVEHYFLITCSTGHRKGLSGAQNDTESRHKIAANNQCVQFPQPASSVRLLITVILKPWPVTLSKRGQQHVPSVDVHHQTIQNANY